MHRRTASRQNRLIIVYSFTAPSALQQSPSNSMNAIFACARVFALGALCLVATGPAAFAEPAPPPAQPGRQILPALASEKAAQSEPGGAETEVCSACKTLVLFDSIHVSKDALAGPRIMGFKHQCALCRGSIMAVKGATFDCMLRDCSICGADASHCRAMVRAHVSEL